MAFRTQRVLEEQGYRLDLETLLGPLSEEQREPLLEALEGLARDKQDGAALLQKNRDLLTKLTSELDMQRKQTVRFE